MNRLGWAILALIVIVVGGFLSVTRFGGQMDAPRPAATSLPVAASGHPGLPHLIVPVAGISPGQFSDDWGDPREDGRRLHHGTDIMAPQGTPVIAAADGTVEKLFQSVKGGTTIYERSPDGRWQYYYAHLSGYAPGVHEGKKVRAGELLGYVGDSGDAAPGSYQLHFGLSFMRPGDGWWQGQPVNPYPLLAGTAAAG